MKFERSEFFQGIRDNLPFMPSATAFGLVAGAVSVQSGLSEFQAALLSAAMFAGNAQLVTMQLLASGAPAIVGILGSIVVNLRHVMYGLSLAPHVQNIPVRWKAVMGFLMVDNVYALSLRRYQAGGPQLGNDAKLSYYLGSGAVGYLFWVVPCVIGAYAGARLPASWQLDLIPSIGMLALVIPNLKDRPTVVAAVVSSVFAILLYDVPLRGGVLIAGAIAMIIGLQLETRLKAGDA